MDGSRFDDLTRLLAKPRSRRGALRLIAASIGAALTGHAAVDAAPKAPKCYGEGSQCTNARQCCSGLCLNRRCAPASVPECTVASDCSAPNECTTATCIAGVCGTTNRPFGTPTTFQTSGDCQRNVCDGNGAVISIADNTDLPTDNNGCTTDTCVNGAPTHTPLPAGTICGENGDTVCNGAGQCVGCLSAADCPGQDTECATRTCIAGGCGMSFAPAGTPLTSQTAGDCQRNVCDGNGNVTSQPDNTDLPDDGNTCTTDICTNGVPSHTPLPAGTTCSTGTCDGAGNCVPATACTPGATQSCYSGPAGTAGVGVCRGGTRTCLPDGSGFGPCVGEITPTVELCDGVDNDCDGVVDNGFELGAPCTNGQLGACHREGTLVCSPDGTGVVCSAPQAQPQPEVCNGIDDDCDGLVDEGAICPPVANGTSACVSGACMTVACNAGFANCNGNPADGCETNVSTNPNHCGGCGIVCSAPANGSAICNGGQCGVTCDDGYAQCSNTCVDLQADQQNCGRCGNTCIGGRVCENGVCVLLP